MSLYKQHFTTTYGKANIEPVGITVTIARDAETDEYQIAVTWDTKKHEHRSNLAWPKDVATSIAKQVVAITKKGNFPSHDMNGERAYYIHKWAPDPTTQFNYTRDH